MGLVPPLPEFLPGLRALCDTHGSLLIFDEVMTGFRAAWGGYQNICGVRPDLTCLGKVIGGGMPVAAYGGARDVMERVSPIGPVYQAGTLSGNPVGMAAGIATLRLCHARGFYDELSRRAQRLTRGLADAADACGIALQAAAVGGMAGLAFADMPIRDFDDARRGDHDRYARFFHAMLDRGVWLPPSGYEAVFVSSAHDDASIDVVIEAAKESLQELAP
jgi:glutamate-1-semialdehyde 2,1-aminomutase